MNVYVFFLSHSAVLLCLVCGVKKCAAGGSGKPGVSTNARFAQQAQVSLIPAAGPPQCFQMGIMLQQ